MDAACVKGRGRAADDTKPGPARYVIIFGQLLSAGAGMGYAESAMKRRNNV